MKWMKKVAIVEANTCRAGRSPRMGAVVSYGAVGNGKARLGQRSQEARH